MLSPIGHGIDLVELEDFRAAMNRNGSRFLNRLFTAEEQAYCEQMADSVSSYAARFAAKEAVSKALGTGIGASASFLEIEVIKMEGSQSPGILLRGAAAETAACQGISQWLVSLTHTKKQAGASVIALGETRCDTGTHLSS